MEDDIDIEEHDLLSDPALRRVFPDLAILKREIIDLELGEGTQTNTEVRKGIVNENQADISLEANSGNPLLASSTKDLDVKPDVLCTDIADTLTILNRNLSESDKVDTHIKKESENILSNELPFYTNRIILGKVNVDATDEDSGSDSNNVVNNKDKIYNEPDIAVAVNTEYRSSRITKQYYETENRLLVKIVLTDCHTSLLGNKCYCAQCTVLFPTTEAYSEHYMSTHTETTNSTKALSNLVTPKIIINNIDKKIECDICKKRFSKKKNLVKHKVVHTGQKPFECETCEKRFSLKSNLFKHNSIHTGEKPFECATCKRSFRCLHHLKLHKCIHSDGGGKKEKLIECDTCMKRFISKSSLISHKLIHTGEKPFECETCKKTFRELGSLNKHKLIHTDQKPFECEICKKSFSRKGYLVKHMFFHTAKKPFECETCKKRCSSKSNLVKHKLIHAGEKPFECDNCNKKYGSRSHLIRHMRVHTGNKPYKCDICHRSYLHLESVKNHKKLKH